MTKLSFLEGFFLTFLIGIPLAFYNTLLATIVAVSLGALVAGSKKGGGFIGLFIGPQIFLSSYYIPVIHGYLSGELGLLNLALLVIPPLIDVRNVMVAIGMMILGILLGHVGTKLYKKEKEEETIELKESEEPLFSI